MQTSPGLGDTVQIYSAPKGGWRAWDGRWLALAMVVVYFLVIQGVASVFGARFWVAWSHTGVPAMPNTFADLHDISVGIDRFTQAKNPWTSEAISHAVSAYSYPKWWLALAVVGLNEKNFGAYGVILALLFLGTVMATLGRIGIVEGLMVGLVLTSPVVMTAVERGNGDMLIFILLAVGLRLRQSRHWATLAFLAAAFLKLYPAAVLLAMATPPWKKSLPWVAGGLVVFGVNVLTSMGDLHQISTGILPMQFFSFGTTPIWMSLPKSFPGTITYSHVLIIGSLCYLVAVAAGLRFRPVVPLQPEKEREFYAFRIGALVFIGTFTLGTNYDYRALFLIFCLPLLFSLIKETGGLRLWARIALGLIVAYNCWFFLFVLTYRTGFQFYLKQLLAWGVLVCLVALLAGAVEPWLKPLLTRGRRAP